MRHGATRLWFRVALLCVGVFPISPVHAQTIAEDAEQDTREVEAKALFAAGREAFDAGRYDAALDRWQEAYDLSKRAALLYNLGLAHDRLRHDDEALTSFKAYLEQVPNADNRSEVEGRMRALDKAKAARNPDPVPMAPQRVARTTAASGQSAAFTQTVVSDNKPLTTQWWFWTAIGAVVAGSTIAAIAITSRDEQAAPFEARSGIVVATLRAQ